MKEKRRWVVMVAEDGSIVLSDELVRKLGWVPGTHLVFELGVH